MSKVKVKFTEDRGNFKKGDVIEVSDAVALQLKTTGKPGDVVDAEEGDKPMSGEIMNKRVDAARAAKARELKKKAKELEDAR